MSVETPIQPDDGKQKSMEDEERVKRYVRLVLFVFLAVFAWYALDLASL